MKLVSILYLTLGSMCSAAFAGANETLVDIVSAEISGENLVVDITYTGCGEVPATIEMNPTCLETYPVQCSADVKLIEHAGMCDAIIESRVEMSLESLGLNDPYYNEGQLTIRSNTDSYTTVTLPQQDL
jgi:hypothetical protein